MNTLNAAKLNIDAYFRTIKIKEKLMNTKSLYFDVGQATVKICINNKYGEDNFIFLVFVGTFSFPPSKISCF